MTQCFFVLYHAISTWQYLILDLVSCGTKRCCGGGWHLQH